MAIKTTFEQARSAAMVGGQISNYAARWAGRQAFEAALFGTTKALEATERGMRVAKQGAKIIAQTAEHQLADNSEIVMKQAHDTWLEKSNAVQGIIETSHSLDTIEEARNVQGRAAITYAELCMEYGNTVSLNEWNMLFNQIMQGGFPVARVEKVIKNLAFTVPVGQTVESGPGLEQFVGTIDPSVPDGAVLQDALHMRSQIEARSDFEH